MAATQYRQLFISLILSLTLLTACTEIENEQADTSSVLNQYAEQYVKLGLEPGEYDKDYIDAYLGPDD